MICSEAHGKHNQQQQHNGGTCDADFARDRQLYVAHQVVDRIGLGFQDLALFGCDDILGSRARDDQAGRFRRLIARGTCAEIHWRPGGCTSLHR